MYDCLFVLVCVLVQRLARRPPHTTVRVRFPARACAVWIWVYYSCGSATSSARDVKQGCRLCTHAFKIMHGRKRTWMTKRKSRGPETDRWCRHAQTPRKRNVAAYGRANWKRSHTYILLGTGRSLKKRKRNILFVVGLIFGVKTV